MAIDKGLYAAPEGITDVEDMADMPAIEIEIEDPESVSIEMGDIEIELRPQKPTAEDFDANLADFMDESELQSLGEELVNDFEKDINDRKDWMQTYVEGMKLLGLKYEERTEPWEGACGVFHPMLTESVVRFQSEGIMETFPAAGPVKTQILGKDTPEKMEASARVVEDMNYQLTEVMTEYRPEHEKMLWNLPISGSAFKKVYFDPNRGRQVAMFIPAEDIVVPYGASSLETSERVTHVMRKTKNEVVKLQDAGFYSDVDLGEPKFELDDIEKQKAEEMGLAASEDDRYRILEMHIELDLVGHEHEDKDGELTGIGLPYVITIDKNTAQILAIRRNWYEGDELHTKRQHFVHYQYIPGFGFYGYGLIHLIGGYARSATMLIRQLVDAGTLSNLPGGLKSRGLRIKGDDTPIQPGEFRDVDVPSGSIRDNILPLPYKEPSQVLMALFQNIVQEGRAFASSGDMNVSDMSANAPVGTTLAILERTLKVMGAVQARMHYSMRQEFRLLKSIIADYAPEEYDYEPIEGSRRARKSDYDMVSVIPISDPNASTMAQKVVQYQAVLQLAQQAPQLYDLPLLHRQMIEVLGVKNASKLVPIEDDAEPTDPIQENQNLITGKPAKAFIEQNHEAHIAVHTSMLQDPKIMAVVGQGPTAQMFQAAMMAHVNEHVAFEYRRQIETQLGLPMPTEEEGKRMPEELAAQVAQLASQASIRLLQQDKQQAAQQQAQQQQQDPVLQMQMQEIQIKMKKLELDEKKVAADAAAKADQLDIERERLRSQERIAGMQIGAKVEGDKRSLSAKQQAEGVRMGIDIAKSKVQAAQQKRNNTGR
tara:strand:- start:1584 stop:4055 length:2472 start_codon:yes stop_codon:yes gene_type:complete